MVTTRNTRADVVKAAGRLFADRGYHGTSMRALGKELGLLGSSLYAHVKTKQDLLVSVVEEGARLFQESAHESLAIDGPAEDRLRALVAGHLDVVLENHDVVRTYLNEARVLDEGHRARVIAARDAYESAFREVIAEGMRDGSFREDADPKMSSIYILSILNAVQRWYRSDGELDRDQLAEHVYRFVAAGLRD